MTTSTTFVGAPAETSLEVLRRAVTGVNARVLTGRQNIASFLQNNEIDVNVTGVNVFGMGDEELLRDQVDGTGRGAAVDAYVRVNATPTIRRLLVTALDVGTGVRSFTLDSATVAGAAGITAMQSRTGELITDYTLTPGYEPAVDMPIASEAIHCRYSIWQTLAVSFVYTGEQTSFYVDVVYTESLDALQELVSDPDVRSKAFDIMVKTAIPIVITAQVTVQYPTGVTAPDADTLAASVSDAVNNLPVGARRLNASVLSKAVTDLNAEYTVLSPLQMAGMVFMPDGRIAYDGSNHYIEAPDAEGISSRNCMFVAYPSDITIVLQEVTA